MKDFMYAAVDKDAWREAAIAQGIAHAETDADGMMTLVYNEGFHADHLGTIGSDPRFHVNLRVLGDDVEREFIRSRRYKPHSALGVEWVPPETVTSPHAIWLGGMDYFAEDLPEVPGAARAAVKAPAKKAAPTVKPSRQPTSKETKSMRKIKKPEPKLPAKKVSAKKAVKKTYRAKKK